VPCVPGLLPRFGDRRRTRVGLLGGSFNPAHAGHLHVAKLARRRLGLHQVWLLVSPGNPLKPAAGMAALPARLAAARAIADGRRVLATDIERRLRTRYTVDTIRALCRRFPHVRFIWLMGADNLVQLPSWRHWRRIVAQVAFAVLPRPTYNHRALASLAARRLHAARRGAQAAPALATLPPPAWMFLGTRQHTASATAIRLSAAPLPGSASSSTIGEAARSGAATGV
jgi:nicotinate-nucleotide adenylyltransferase